MPLEISPDHIDECVVLIVSGLDGSLSLTDEAFDLISRINFSMEIMFIKQLCIGFFAV